MTGLFVQVKLSVDPGVYFFVFAFLDRTFSRISADHGRGVKMVFKLTSTSLLAPQKFDPPM